MFVNPAVNYLQIMQYMNYDTELLFVDRHCFVTFGAECPFSVKFHCNRAITSSRIVARLCSSIHPYRHSSQ